MASGRRIAGPAACGRRIAEHVAVGVLGLWQSDCWACGSRIAACGHGLLRMWPTDCCANFRRIAGPVAVALLEARNGKWIWLKHCQAAKGIANQIAIFHRNRRCEDVQQTLQPGDVKQTPTSALKCRHQLISSVGSEGASRPW